MSALRTLLILAGGSMAGAGLAAEIPAIPDPGFCLSFEGPELPQDLADAAETHYYIDNSHPLSMDILNPRGTRGRPRSTIPWGELAAGAYVEIHGGPYESKKRRLLALGEPGNPVRIRGADAADPVVFRNRWSVEGSYVILENLRFEGSQNGITLSGTHYGCIRNSQFAGPGKMAGNTSVIAIHGGPERVAWFNVVANNVISGFGVVDSAKENDYHGIFPVQYAKYTWVIGNEVFDNGGDAVQVGRTNLSGDARPSFVFIGGNEFYGNRENAVDVKRATDVVISGNRMYGYEPRGSSSGEAVIIHNEPERVWVLHNTISAAEYGVVVTGSSPAWVVNNVFFDIRHSSPQWNPGSVYASGAAIHFRGASSGGAIGNTIAFSDVGIQLTQGLPGGYMVHNNIVAARSQAAGYDVAGGSGNFLDASRISHNLFFSREDKVRIFWRGRSYESVRDAMAASGQFANSVQGNPLFIDPVGRDFHVAGRSIANGAGISIDLDAPYRKRYKVGIGHGGGKCGSDADAARDIGARFETPCD
jgi:hypothetical protein